MRPRSCAERAPSAEVIATARHVVSCRVAALNGRGSRRSALSAKLIIAFAASLSVACAGAQSTLDPAGKQAEELATLFWGLIVGTAVIWLVVVGLALYAAYVATGPLTVSGGRKLIIGGGIVIPGVVLCGLLAYSLSMLPRLLAAAPEGALRVRVTAHQYWWRVTYEGPSGAVELANEIHLPVGRPVEFQLESTDVIHAFWIPSLGGKVDMIPGRRTRLLLEPTRVGTYRGVCAEYCGTSHAQMGFGVVVETEAEFERWLTLQTQPAMPARGDIDAEGANVFLATGCGACHSVRGILATGTIGPDLTHVAGRRFIGAGIMEPSVDAFAAFIARPGELKSGIHMPAFGMLSQQDVSTLAHYLDGLK